MTADALAYLWTDLSLRVTDKNRSKLQDLEFSLLMLLLSVQSILRQLEGRKPPVPKDEE